MNVPVRSHAIFLAVVVHSRRLVLFCPRVMCEDYSISRISERKFKNSPKHSYGGETIRVQVSRVHQSFWAGALRPRPRIVLHVDDPRREPTYVSMKRATCVIVHNTTGSRVHHRGPAVQPFRWCRNMATIIKPIAVPISIFPEKRRSRETA